MKLSIFLVFLYGYICHGTEIWYQIEMSLYLVPPFQNVYTTLQKDILGELLNTDFNLLTGNNGALTSVTSNLYCQMEKLLQHLDTSVAASNSILIKVENKLTTIANDIAIKENEIARLDDQIRNVNAIIQTKQAQINGAEQSVRQAENAVSDAEKELRNAEKEVEDAQLCAGLIGRRKRFLGNLWNSIQNSVLKPIESAVNQAGNAIGSVINDAGNAIGSVINQAGGAIVDNVVKPVCTAINFQQIDNARRKVENKKNELQSFRNQLITLKVDLTSKQGELTTFNAQLFNLNYELSQLKNSLIELPNEQHIIISIHQKLTDIVSHIRARFGRSTSFANVMTAVVDFESTVKPLNAIYDELQQKQFMPLFNPGKIFMEEINQAKTNLQKLITSTSNVSFNMGSINCSN